MPPTIAETIEFIKVAHAGVFDKIGKPYWEHPVRVMNNLGPDAADDEKKAALLHDVIEDTKYTARDLLIAGFGWPVVEAVILLSRVEPSPGAVKFFDRKPGKPTYHEFIDSIAKSGNKIAIKVKIADLMDNLDPERVAKLPAHKMHLPERYKASLPILKAALE
jgi:(p)ppGpp synthase/HD superfamily hydrolase